VIGDGSSGAQSAHRFGDWGEGLVLGELTSSVAFRRARGGRNSLSRSTGLRLAAWVPDCKGVDSYLICGTPRTGSTLLCGLLTATGVAGRPEDGDRISDEWVPRFDSAEVHGYVETIDEHNAAWREWFDASAVAPFPVL
jgi:hypothetical protein